MFVLAITTGLRQGELLALKSDDLDLDEGVVRVRRTLSLDGRKIVFASPKTAKGKRSIGLTGPDHLVPEAAQGPPGVREGLVDRGP